MLPQDLTASVDDIQLLSQYLSNISETEINENVGLLACHRRRKMTFQLGRKFEQHDAKRITIRFTPEFLESFQATPILTKRTSVDLTSAFKNGHAILEVLKNDNSRTAYASKEAAEQIKSNKLQLKKDGAVKNYAEIKIVDKQGFETIANTLFANLQTAEPTETVSRSEITEYNEATHEHAEKHAAPLQVAVQKGDKIVSVKTVKHEETDEEHEDKVMEKEQDVRATLKKHDQEHAAKSIEYAENREEAKREASEIRDEFKKGEEIAS